MGRYTHLTLAEREEIMLLAHEDRSHGDIAGATGRSKSTISREIARNSFAVGRGRPLPRVDRATQLRVAQARLREARTP